MDEYTKLLAILRKTIWEKCKGNLYALLRTGDDKELEEEVEYFIRRVDSKVL